MEKPKKKPATRAEPREDESSGVREAQPREPTSERWGVWGEELARRLVDELGAAVLRRFPRLDAESTRAITDAASSTLVRGGPPQDRPIEAYVRHIVHAEAVKRDRRRFLVETCEGEPAEVRRALDLARARLPKLSAREGDVLLAVFTLDDVAEDDEVSKVVLHAAVSLQMRWNTAHQNLSRAWRKLAAGGLAAWELDWRSTHRLIREPTSFPMWIAARAYLDACGGRGALAGPAFDAWTAAHEAHNAAFNEWKRRGVAAMARWREFLESLDEARIPPAEVAESILGRCAALGIDRWVVPARLDREARWAGLLAKAPRPSQAERAEWRAFVHHEPFGASVAAALRALDRESALTEVAAVDIDAAYQQMLQAAASRPAEGVRAKEAFRALLEGGRWT